MASGFSKIRGRRARGSLAMVTGEEEEGGKFTKKKHSRVVLHLKRVFRDQGRSLGRCQSRARAAKQRKLTMVVPLGSVSRAAVCGGLLVICSAVFECDARLLPQDEVDTLRTIATKMRNKYWNVTETSCSDGIGLNVTTLPSGMASTVSCSCSFVNGTVCHVKSIQLKGLSLTGIFPDEFGNLTYLREIDLTSNYISGSLFTTLTQIPFTVQTALGNCISGIPREIGNINMLEDLVLEDNLLEGTLEPNIGNLSLLKKLQLSANNFMGTIPKSFANLKNLETFRIDGSTLLGKIPNFIGNWTKITRLDMQGTSMEGPIPLSISLLTNSTELDLGVNRLTGQVPDKMGAALDYMFLANNSLRGEVPNWHNSSYFCPLSCLYNIIRLTHADHSLFINCGGNKMTFEGNDYEEDTSANGPSIFSSFSSASSEEWAYSSTGLYMGKADAGYTANNPFSMNVNGSEFYKTARLSPWSIRYYGLCMMKGSYKVRLHFAEIQYSEDETFSSLGRRIFDASIQVINTDFDVGSAGLSTGVITGIAVASVVLLVSILLVLWLTGFLGGREVKEPDLQTGPFTLRQIKAATNNFDSMNKIGEGGFGPVYKGILLDGIVFAVKQHSPKSKQGNREFFNEIGMISALQHPNLIKLYGCCIERNQLLLLYEYLENNSLARIELDWATRKKIGLGIARGLAYLHEETGSKIVHRDIKATNVLLDKELNAKISDFGLAKLNEEENTHISTRVVGIIGYMAPEYAMRGYLTNKAHVYSFGVVALEIVSGKSNTNYGPKEEFVYLLD
ncbi:hypothetical protein BT93_F1992 [Corymbia citriodora subsp. variegata]|nr:hypothetical protein BT93_F1992 [Corymbia citriodora subsp. variegata]